MAPPPPLNAPSAEELASPVTTVSRQAGVVIGRALAPPLPLRQPLRSAAHTHTAWTLPVLCNPFLKFDGSLVAVRPLAAGAAPPGASHAPPPPAAQHPADGLACFLPPPHPTSQVHSPEEYEALLAANPGRLAVLMCKATHCRPCKMFSRKYARAAAQYSDALWLEIFGDETKGTRQMMIDMGIRVVRERGKAYICAALPPCVQGNKRVGGAGGGIERRHVPQGARGLVAIITPALRHRRLPWPLAPQSFRSPPRPPANTLTHTAEAGSREGSSGGGGERGGVRRVRYMSGCGKSWPQCF